jgi:chemotaxis protein methyltransferase CheR
VSPAPESPAASPAASADLLRLLSALLEDRFGLRFNDSNYDLMVAGLRRVAASRHVRTAELLRQLLLLQPGDELLQSVVQGVTIGETYFFRHPEHFALVGDVIAPQLIRGGRTRARALSVGCATGEEAYSLAMVLLQSGIGDVHVLGCDVNRASLEQAEQGRYGRRSVRGESPLLERYLMPTADSGGGVVASVLRQHTQFRYLNLGEDGSLARLVPDEQFDVIFCRNVLLYLAPQKVLRVVEQLRDLLAPDGYLVLSALDLPEPLAGLEQVMLAGVPVLRRKIRRSSSQTIVPLAALPPHIEAVPQVAVSERSSSAPYRDAAVGLLAAAKDAADAGKLARALEEVRSALSLRRSPEALHLLAMILNEQGDRIGAEAALQEAVDREPDFILGHLSLGLQERPPGRRWLSGRHLGIVLHLLQSRGDSEILGGPEPLLVGHARRLASVALADLVRKATEEAPPSFDPAAAVTRSGGSR